MLNSTSSYLGTGLSSVKQTSIDIKINYKDLINIIVKNSHFFEQYNLEIKDEYAKKLLQEIKNLGKLPFPVTKQIELYVLNNKKNLKKTWSYLIFRYKFFKAATEKINFGYPPYLLVEPVSSCNLKCPFCFQIDKSFTRKPFMGLMKLDFFKKIVTEANQIGVGAITLGSRGEPTLHKQLDLMLNVLGDQKNIYEVKLNTNATFLNEKLCHAIFKNKVSLVVISADHYIKKDYEELRYGSNFDKILKNVDNLYNIRNKYYRNTFTEIRISGVDARKNLNRDEFKNFWIKRSDHVTASLPLERWNTYENEKHPHITKPCQNLWDRMYIWFDGKVNPCDADYKSMLSYGDYNQNNIKEIWNSQKINSLREMHTLGKRSNKIPCDRCGYY